MQTRFVPLARTFFFALLAIPILPTELFGQGLAQVGAHADCRTAIRLERDTLFGPTTPPQGYGNVLEIRGNPSKSLYAFTREHHTVWYSFEAAHTGELTLEITPLVATNDYDFLLFKGSPETLCEDIAARRAKPIRTNISRVQPERGGKTGLSRAATSQFVHSGPGEAYSAALKVVEGEQFLLVVDNVYPNGEGHTLTLQYHPDASKQAPTPAVVQKTPPTPEAVSAEPLVLESIATKPIALPGARPAEIKQIYTLPEVRSLVQEKTVRTVTVRGTIAGDFSADIVPIVICRDQKTNEPLATITAEGGQFAIEIPLIKGLRNYRLEFFADGHFFSDTLFSARELDKMGETALVRTLQPLEIGTVLSMSQINFYGDSPEPLPESRYLYYNIWQIMNAYEGMRIKVEGHTNGCGGDIIQSAKLSQARANSVRQYLAGKGIEESRIEIKGWGCSKMIYPIPKNDYEASTNRRVEIQILEF